MNYTFENIVERDIDFLILDRLQSSTKLLNLFLSEAALTGYTLISGSHSVMDSQYGGSDIIAVVQKGEDKHALLIENKINAAAQPNQYERYQIRGSRDYHDNYTIFLIAPQSYLESNYEAQEKYEYVISYERIRDTCFIHDPFAYEMITKAIEKKEKPGSSIISDATTDSWHHYYQYQITYAPDLKMQYEKRLHGRFSAWPHYRIPHAPKGLAIIHKTRFKNEDFGTVELQFNNMASRKNQLKSAVSGLLTPEMYWKPAGKSVSIAIQVPKMDFAQSFFLYVDQMPQVFDAVRKLQSLAREIGNIPGILD